MRRRTCSTYCFLILYGYFYFLPGTGNALTPDEILVIANENVGQSIELANFYMQKRGIPGNNLLKLQIEDNETCSRNEYEKKIAEPIRNYLDTLHPQGKIRCLVTMFGLPLKIAPPIGFKPETGGIVRGELQPKDLSSSLDSELALVRESNYSLSGAIPNPFYIGFKENRNSIQKKKILMISRLDAPSPEIVKRMIIDSMETERKGLKGTAYFDARWPVSNQKKLSPYQYYDNSLYLAANRIRRCRSIPVIMESSEKLFQRNECPEAALYCGWYSLASYVDAFDWQPGAVGYHIASGECKTLKAWDSRVWCKVMLEKGIAATIGPVSEPYVNAFPPPEVFFGFLVDGYLSLAECYLVSTPYFSWKMVLIGDPLYQPYKNTKCR